MRGSTSTVTSTWSRWVFGVGLSVATVLDFGVHMLWDTLAREVDLKVVVLFTFFWLVILQLTSNLLWLLHIWLWPWTLIGVYCTQLSYRFPTLRDHYLHMTFYVLISFSDLNLISRTQGSLTQFDEFDMFHILSANWMSVFLVYLVSIYYSSKQKQKNLVIAAGRFLRRKRWSLVRFRPSCTPCSCLLIPSSSTMSSRESEEEGECGDSFSFSEHIFLSSWCTGNKLCAS